MAAPKKPKPKRTVGRPKKIIDWSEVDNLLEAQLDGTEIAEMLGISAMTLYRACESEHKVNFDAYSQQKRAKGTAHAKKTFYHEAFKSFDIEPKDKTTKQIFWLKNNAGWSDKKEVKQDLTATVIKEVVQVELPSNQPDEDTPKPWQADPVPSE